MKKVLLVTVMMAMIACVLTACKKQSTEPEVSETQSQEEKNIVGGWSINNETVSPVYTQESYEIFEKALAEYNGTEMEPVALLATQLVSGRNYSFLCKSKIGDPKWYITVVYADLQGNAKITSSNEIDINNIRYIDAQPDGNIVGGWKMMPLSNAITLKEDVWRAFFKASENYVGVNLAPLALLASQVVSGTNYLILCSGTTVTADPVEAMYVVKLYVDTKGEAKIDSVEMFDLLSYQQ